MPIDLIIFDCDGVLVDSEVISCRAHALVLTRHGYPITAEQALKRFLGVSEREARQIVENEIGRNDPCWCGSGKKYKRCHGAGLA